MELVHVEFAELEGGLESHFHSRGERGGGLLEQGTVSQTVVLIHLLDGTEEVSSEISIFQFLSQFQETLPRALFGTFLAKTQQLSDSSQTSRLSVQTLYIHKRGALSLFFSFNVWNDDLQLIQRWVFFGLLLI